MYNLNPYLTVKGVTEAIPFYAKAFGAKEVERMPAQDGKRVMHAELEINGGKVMMSDPFPEYSDGGAKITPPSVENPSPVAIVQHFAKPADVDAAYKRAMDAGCKNVMKPEDTFWKARFAVVMDPFGHRWMLNAPL